MVNTAVGYCKSCLVELTWLVDIVGENKICLVKYSNMGPLSSWKFRDITMQD